MTKCGEFPAKGSSFLANQDCAGGFDPERCKPKRLHNATSEVETLQNPSLHTSIPQNKLTCRKVT
jgi:hypothetical protein